MQQLVDFLLLTVMDKLKPIPLLGVSLKPKTNPKPARKSSQLSNFLVLTIFLSVIGVVVLGIVFIGKKISNKRKKQIIKQDVTKAVEASAISEQQESNV